MRVFNKGKIQIDIENQYRFDNRISHLESAFISPSIDYKMNKHFELSYAYRLILQSSGTDPVSFTTHRSGIDIKCLKLEKFILDGSRFSISFRIRGTLEYSRFKGYDSYLRFSPEFAYNLKGTKMTPSLSAEFFLHFKDQVIYTFNDVRVANNFNKARIKAGLRYPLTKKLDGDFNLIYQHRFPISKKELIPEINLRYKL